MLKDLKRFKRKKTWVKIYLKSGKEQNGQIDHLSSKILKLGYARRKINYRSIIKISQIESIESLRCENTKVWTND